jgi:CheY-like chemotaxis protein
VLLNLALNARDAMPGSGRLRIETRRGTQSRFVHLNVSDTGQGMDDETRARAFEPFFTTKPAGAGTGLGLSTSYGIVRQTGGSISLESALGRGTRVEISLPACATRPAPAKRHERAASAPAGREASILLVEDDASVRRLLAILLESAGYRVTAAADGAEALAIVAESQRRFDLLLSDYVMPGQSGLELANALRASWPELHVVLMTGHAEIPGSAVAELPRGAELLGKPFTREQLQRVITGMLAAI